MMSSYVAGSNLFGQWNFEDPIINKFRAIKGSANESSISQHLRHSKLLHINWSYNILVRDKIYSLIGFFRGKEYQLVKVTLPDQDEVTSDNFLVAGNDFNIVVVSKSDNILWAISLKIENKIKKIILNVEEPEEVLECVEKKQKLNLDISKIELSAWSCLYLTSSGHVYSGILPSYVDTSHCRGEVCDIKCGYEHFVILTDTGYVYTWGNGRRLQLGHGNVHNADLPVELEAVAGIKIVKISAGGWHSLALSESGDLYAWGWNDTGQLGIKNKQGHESYIVPTLVDIFDENGVQVHHNVEDIACGSRHSAILLQNNTVWTTGLNKYGQLGFSEQEFPVISSFKKAFDCEGNSRYTLMCGAWSTVIIPSQ
ncbi:uncharacterized protein LOC142979388 [Anticarsia gemmatalis]|uniref:uncharacterized protein LOC142979388 n=1 Tax=Anticarsia gemmatalis TaxID=129554 RepID=UPI003F7605AC